MGPVFWVLSLMSSVLLLFLILMMMYFFLKVALLQGSLVNKESLKKPLSSWKWD